jgi:hypothetical protein
MFNGNPLELVHRVLELAQVVYGIALSLELWADDHKVGAAGRTRLNNATNSRC